MLATTLLKKDHGIIERHLDILIEAIRAAADPVEPFRRTWQALALHYRREEQFLEKLGRVQPKIAGKIVAQHAEAAEIAARLEEAIAAGQSADVLALARRFHAIAQHNIIEEERDVFPVADRSFTPEEHEELRHRLEASS